MRSPRFPGRLPLPQAGEGRGESAASRRLLTPSTCERPALTPTLSREREREKGAS